MQRPIAVIAVALGLVAVVIAVGSAGGEDLPHRLTVIVPDATNVVKGQKIRIAGSPVGKITAVEAEDRGRAAKLSLRLGDRAWPVPVGSQMALRWGGTASFSNRYIALERTRGAGRVYGDGAAFAARDFSVPVEFDALLRTFDARTRAGVSDFLQQSGAALHAGRGALRSALRVAPPALTEGAHVLRDIEEQDAAVKTIIRSGSSVMRAVNASEPDVKALLSGAGDTFDAVADQADGLREGIGRAPATFVNVRDTLKRADPTLAAVRDLATRLAPGVGELNRTAAPLTDVLGTVRRVGPDARATLATLRRAAPDLNPLLAKLRDLSPTLGHIGSQAIDNLECIRPYTPDVIAFFTNWGDFFSNPDTKDEIIRAQVENFLPAGSNLTPYNSAQAKQLFGGLEFGFPRPPGTNAGQPWFLPQCGAGRDALDPEKDTETRSAIQSMPLLRPIVPVAKAGK